MPACRHRALNRAMDGATEAACLTSFSASGNCQQLIMSSTISAVRLRVSCSMSPVRCDRWRGEAFEAMDDGGVMNAALLADAGHALPSTSVFRRSRFGHLAMLLRKHAVRRDVAEGGRHLVLPTRHHVGIAALHRVPAFL